MVARLGWARVLTVAWLVLAACGPDRRVQPVDSSGLMEWLVERHFGPDRDPDAVVARIDERHITVGDLALCHEREPVLTVTQCLDELVATALAIEPATAVDRLEPSVAEARSAALASAFLRERVDRPLAASGLPDDVVEAFVDAPDNHLYFAAPAIRQCSHLLVYDQEGASDAASELAHRMFAQVDWSGVHAVNDLQRIRREWTTEARTAGLSLRVEEHLLVQADTANPDAWPGLPQFVTPFTEAALALSEPGDVSGPVQTRFGTHFILFEREFPAHRLDPAAARQLARSELAQRRRFERLQTLRAELLENSEIVRFRTTEVFGMSDEQLLRQRSAEIREGLGVE